MSEQQAAMVEWVDPATLKAHPKNEEIYGQDGFEDLVESISELGVLQALYVTPKGVVISGHRRWRAAKKAIVEVPVIRAEYENEIQAIIEHNRYRIKNGLQLYNEGKELETMEAEKAKERQRGGQGGVLLVESFPQARTRDKVAETIGLGSGRQLDKLNFVAEHRPELLPKIRKSRSLDSAYQEAKRIDRQEDIGKLPPKELEGLYNVFLADPPWQYDNEGTAIRGPAENHYETMPFDEILKLPVSEHSLDDSVLFLWTTNSMLKKALLLIDHWGFDFKTSMVWVKDRIGTGFFVRSKHEIVLISTKGKMLPMTTNIPASVFEAPKSKHSKKPAILYELIEQMYPGQKYAELFARDTRDDWYSWGKEV